MGSLFLCGRSRTKLIPVLEISNIGKRIAPGKSRLSRTRLGEAGVYRTRLGKAGVYRTGRTSRTPALSGPPSPASLHPRPSLPLRPPSPALYRTSRTSRTSRTALSIDLQLPPSCPSQLSIPDSPSQLSLPDSPSPAPPPRLSLRLSSRLSLSPLVGMVALGLRCPTCPTRPIRKRALVR